MSLRHEIKRLEGELARSAKVIALWQGLTFVAALAALYGWLR